MGLTLQAFKAWLWQRRQVLVTTTWLVLLLEGMFVLGEHWPWWILGLTISLAVGTLWVHCEVDSTLWWSVAENLWVASIFVTALVFLVKSDLTFHTLVLLFAILMFGLLRSQQDYREQKVWVIGDLPRLQIFSLIGFLLVVATAYKMTELYMVGPWLIVLITVLFGGFSLALNLFRMNVEFAKISPYLLVYALIIGETAGLIAPWSGGIYFKAFVVSTFHLLLTELIGQFERCSLTLRVVTEYILITGFILIALFVTNYFIKLI